MDVVVAAVGWTGAGLLLVAYALASAGRIAARGYGFQLLNLMGALALTVNSASHGAWPSAVLNAAWITTGLVALTRGPFPAGVIAPSERATPDQTIPGQQRTLTVTEDPPVRR